jgi:hypothetical protein
MQKTTIKISSIVESQLPQFVREEYPLVGELLSQYYRGEEFQGGTLDILRNISDYVKIDNLSNLVGFCTLTNDVSVLDTTIYVDSTNGFPESYGLIKIDSEIITYTSIGNTYFSGCVRGFSGITSHRSNTEPDLLVFSSSEIVGHSKTSSDGNTATKVENLSILFLQEFLRKIKKQITPGFEDRDFYPGVNDNIIIKQAKDFYSSKGTDSSFKILFESLYGEDVKVIKPKEFLFKPSDAQYRISKDLVVEPIEGDPSNLLNKTIYQDQTDIFNKATGTVFHVEKILRGTKEYYVISVDYDYNKDINVSGSVFGSFPIHPKTQLIESFDLELLDNTLNVESTAGFPNSGKLVVVLSNGGTFTITYEGKSLTQFYNCSGILENLNAGQEIRLDVYSYGHSNQNDGEIIKFRITGVLSDLKTNNDTFLYEKGDRINVYTLGYDGLNDIKSENWFFNTVQRYDIKSIELLDPTNYVYKINTYDEHKLNIGDSVALQYRSFSQTSEISRNIIVHSYESKNSFLIKSLYLLPNLNQIYGVKRNLSKVDCVKYPKLVKYTSNVQNVYKDSNNNYYVASPSLPTYLNQQLYINDRSVTFSGSFDNDGNILLRDPINPRATVKHYFYTGDSIVYTPNSSNQNLKKGIYFVKRVDEYTIKLYYSSTNIETNNHIYFPGPMDGKLEFSYYTYENTLESQILDSQRLIRKISNPEPISNPKETYPGATGILVNGVEILNYKSRDSIYYGSIEDIEVLRSGEGFNVINPPVLQISDSTGTGASGHCCVIGSLDRIDIVDPGFDYLDEPNIVIKGGNGKNAEAKARLIEFEHIVYFNSQPTALCVNISDSSIVFPKYHKFRDFESVLYRSYGQQEITGLISGSIYYVKVINEYKVQFYSSFEDAVNQVNKISLTGHGIGNHSFQSTKNKNKIGSIDIIDPGFDYANQKIIVSSSGINTASNTILFKNHGYQSGEIVVYKQSSVTPISGLTTQTSYYVTKVNDDEFRLSRINNQAVGINSSNLEFYYTTNQYVNLTSTGEGFHEFNYEPITVEVIGNIGVSSVYNQNFSAILQPIFKGGISKVFLETNGSSYGNEEIINYEKQPTLSLLNGSGALVRPVINNGSIVDILVQNPGINYNCPPDLVVNGDGFGALLVPIVENGYLKNIKIVDGGFGYNESNTTINVISTGYNQQLKANIKSWRINLVERSIQNNQITDDDGFIDSGLNDSYGLQYTHAYAGRKFRSSTLSSRYVNGVIRYYPDLQMSGGIEVDSPSHSPIIGWAYDGNPIYGPYAYSSKDGGPIRSLKSSYILQNSSNRPNISNYPLGIFVEDYVYNASGDLDEFNGRFCKTPEFPNGVYAYFCTIENIVQSFGPFKNYKKPSFPYIIGNYYKSKPIDFNFNKSSNQNEIDINKTGWLRNTSAYNLLQEKSGYDYIFRPYKIKEQFSIINSVSRGKVDSIGILTGGYNYKVKDKVIFDNTKTTGTDVSAEVSLIKGKKVNYVSTASSITNNVELIAVSPSSFVGFTTLPHDYNNNDIVSFTGLYDFKKYGTIKISENQLFLRTGVSSVLYTGIVTYFDVFGSLDFPRIRENDIYQIENEQVKILNIDPSSSRIRVLRNQNGTVGVTSYSSGFRCSEITRKFEVSFGISSSYSSTPNKEIYFDPYESVGIGTSVGVGINSTIYFSNPGIGPRFITIPTKTIYLPNHQLNTGSELIYSSNGGSPISISTDGYTSTSLPDNSVVYVAKITDNLIGISTVLVGLDTTGNFSGIGTNSSISTLYFTNKGSGNYHSFKTNYQDTLVGDLSRNTVTVFTKQNHNLQLNDNVIIDISSGITTVVNVQYNDYNRRLVVNSKNFSESDVDILKNTIRIPNHNFQEGQKVIYKSTASGIETIYYVIIVDSNRIKLSNSYYEATLSNPIEVNIGFAKTSGSLLPINPPIELYKNSIVKFDLSDSSLSYSKNFTSYPAFHFDFYKDPDFKYKYEISEGSLSYEVYRIGKIGIDSTAAVYLTITDNTPQNLYYRLEPIDPVNNLPEKLSIIVDDDQVINHNKLYFVDSKYNGTHTISGIGSTSFTFSLLDTPEKNSYYPYEGDLNYYTNSSTASGEIYELKLTSKGRSYNNVPDIVGVVTNTGNSAILECQTNSIGKILNTTIKDIGFDYSSDLSLRPSAKLPSLVKLQSLYSLDYIGITSSGRNYVTPPDLLLFDGYTQKIVTDVDLRYVKNRNRVTILKNTTSLYNSIPTILPINNSNGIKIKSITYEPTTGIASVTLAPSYSDRDVFPFEVGDNVMIEHTSVGIATTGKGYNTEDYNYQFFEIVSMDPNIGGANGSVRFSLNGLLSPGEYPGTYDSDNSLGTIVPEKFFPIFKPVLKKNNFFVGETVISKSSQTTGVVDSWNTNSNYLKVLEDRTKFNVGETIVGKSSKTQGVISDIIRFDAVYDVNGSSIVRKGWNLDTGFLNEHSQRLHDSDYYQNFSYSLKSKVPYDVWNTSVSVLNHTAGFKRFSDLIIESVPIPKSSNIVGIGTTVNVGVGTVRDDIVGMQTSQNNGDFSSRVDIIEYVDTNTIYDFDLVKERTISNRSNNLVFNSRVIQDYIESVGNRVLILDDLSPSFNSNPRPTIFTPVDQFNLNYYRSKKYFALVQDRANINGRQANLVTLVQNGKYGFISQYGILNTISQLGYYDFSISGDRGSLDFYPLLYSINNYDISLVSFDTIDKFVGIGTTTLGNVVKIDSSTSSLPVGFSTQKNIVGISSTYRTSKILVTIGSTENNYYEYNELTLLHDGTNVNILEFGRLNTDTLGYNATTGLGTYSASLSGSNVYLNFQPYTSLTHNYVVNTVNLSIGNTSTTATDSILLSNSNLKSTRVAISSSPSPSAVGIATYSKLYYKSCYLIVSIEDKTNQKYQVSEVALVDDDITTYLVEYGVVPVSSGLGTFSSSIVGSGSTLSTVVYFTPNPNINAEVRVFQTSLGNYGSNLTSLSTIDFAKNAAINANNAIYIGNELDIKKQFDLTYKQNPVFVQSFDSTDNTVVDIANDQFNLINHYFTNGEKVVYSYGDPTLYSPVGIATTTISGISTNVLPSSLYIVKVNESAVKVAASATDALSSPPKILDINSLGIGTVHTFTAVNQNVKSLITIDNVIQSPIVGTNVTCFLDSDIGGSNETLVFTGISSFFGGDIVQIDDELMKIQAIGIGSTNYVLVQRPWLGTVAKPHSKNSLIKKVSGNYNIVDNTLYFAEAPYGKFIPPNTFNDPLEVDYTGLITASSFSGRIFLRSGLNNSGSEAYSGNYIFDDISQQFNGTRNSFNITSNNQNITGFSTGNAIVLYNDIFQNPLEFNSINNIADYRLLENSGITSITFTGSNLSAKYDINTGNLPRGGIILSVGSSQGYGYQPLISAGGTCTLSGIGSIQSISIGNSGSGYRVGIQTVRVGVQTYSVGKPNITYVGIASISKGNIVSVAITNPGVGYTNYSTFAYSYTSAQISAGSTIIPLNNITNIITGNYISVGSALTNVYVTGIGSTFVTIGVANTTNRIISYGSTTTIKSYSPPKVIFDDPIPYTNIPLSYSSESTPGIGTQATIDIVVGQGSSVISFEIKNYGYAYGNKEILTVPVGGSTGIPTDTTKTFTEFKLYIDKVFNDKFSGWTVGDLQVLDPINAYFDGVRKVFPINLNGQRVSIVSRKGSTIELQANLLVFINNTLQVPGISYIFNGGSNITFLEAPKAGDLSKLVFYAGTSSIDTVVSNILESIKVGDTVQVIGDTKNLVENERVVTDIVSTDEINTNVYRGPGITLDQTLLRPLNLYKQTEDRIVYGKYVAKDRPSYEPLIYPSTNIIQSIGSGTSVFYVENVKTIFDNLKENVSSAYQSKIEIISQDVNVGAYATAIVSAAGSITSFNIINSGSGYLNSPSVHISSPTGIGTTAIITSTIANGSITNLSISNSGSGYDPQNPPLLLIDPPTIIDEVDNNVLYYGDFGNITQIRKTSVVGVASTGLYFNFFIPLDSPLRDQTVVGTAITISTIQSGDYFVVNNSKVGSGLTSLNSTNSTVGIATSCIDTVYQVLSSSVVYKNVAGIGITAVKEVLVGVSSYKGYDFSLSTFDCTTLTFDSTSSQFTFDTNIIYYANYSWGKIIPSARTTSSSFNFYGTNGITGITTSAIIKRYNPLTYVNYT